MPHQASFILQRHQHLDAQETDLTYSPVERVAGGGGSALPGQRV